MNDPINHLGSIWYPSEPSDVPYSPNQFLVGTFFPISYSKTAVSFQLCQLWKTLYVLLKINSKNWGSIYWIHVKCWQLPMLPLAFMIPNAKIVRKALENADYPWEIVSPHCVWMCNVELDVSESKPIKDASILISFAIRRFAAISQWLKGYQFCV